MTGAGVRAGLLLAAAAAGAACTSPESQRTRGGGPGADPGNRPAAVMMHGGSDPFWKTPDRIGDVHDPPVEPGLHARQISEP